MTAGFPSQRFTVTAYSFEERMERRRAIENLRREITELAGHLNAGHYRFLKLIGELERCRGWADTGCHLCAHWLNWRCGIDMGAAREKVRTALALEKLPRIAAAMERGELSYARCAQSLAWRRPRPKVGS